MGRQRSLGQGNLDAFDEVYAEDYIWHRPPFPDISGLTALKESVNDMREAYSDLEVFYDEMIAEGESIAYRFTIRGRHTGQSATLPVSPTGKEVTLVGCSIYHVAGDKIVEEFEHSDYLGFLQQFGVVPPLG